MFEKDIYQLIRGLRAHKGNERAYIQDSLRECRKEIKSQDMDQKATALLKLVYLEMFGHDMSWASFNVLEVMSSPKYLQKRVGYLAAVQSFRPDTEVLMLAENLLKKDLNSPDKILMSLPLVAIPHVISPSMANSLLTDLLPRMSHSNPAIRKKTIVTLYRLALVYPETLRPAWPKIKEHLLDENEDPSVTAAIVNVVCELGWRRPQDFLPLAPRLFELLTAGGNNWMAIKIIKLFSVLTPLEPRLVKKLLPPLTSIIKTTPAMSLLYECINGIIQGGIMEAAGGTTEGDEIARLCVNKLRAMLVVQGDPNLRYVALLAFTKITNSHADIVSQHQDVIMECIDDGDISIRTRALDLVVGMVSAYNLQIVVERLLKQLRTADRATAAEEATEDRGMHSEIVPMADDEEDAAAAKVKARQKAASQTPPLPDDYRTSVIERILEMCSRDTYTNMNDFEWYIGVLVELVKQCPSTASAGRFGSSQTTNLDQSSVANAIGAELLNVAVRVKAARPEAAAAAQSLLLFDRRERNFPAGSSGGQDVLIAAAFIAGEYANMLPDPEAVLTSLIHTSSAQLPAKALTSYLQAVPKVFAVLTGSQEASWTTTRRSTTTLFIARIINFVEPLTLHPNLDVQERAVEYLDLMRLASEAVASQQTESADENYAEPPLLLTQAIPALFSGTELNPVAAAALRKVPQPDELDLDSPINSNLQMLLAQAEYDTDYEDSNNEVYRFYHDRAAGIPVVVQKSAAELLDDPASNRNASYQDAGDEPLTAEAIERKKAERRERYRDDPYYIDSDRGSGISTPMHNILHAANGDELDVDAIPVLELQLDPKDLAGTANPRSQAIGKPNRRQPKRHFEIAGDETFDDNDSSTPSSFKPPSLLSGPNRPKKSLLEVDSSGLSALSLTSHDDANGNAPLHPLEIERRQAEEAAMAQALKEVERLRLQMQRAQERVGGEDDDDEATTTVVKRKKPRKKKVPAADDEEGQPAGEDKEKKKKKKKKKVSSGDGEERSAAAGAAVVSERSHRDDGGPPTETAAAGEEEAARPATKKKKKRQVVFD